MEFFHSVTLDQDLCMGCINCIKRCPTEAIRVRDGKASIIGARCIDCGECIRICPHHAKKATYDPLEVLNKFEYTVALPAPALYGQFNNLHEVDTLLAGLRAMGFDEVAEVAAAAELVSAATRRILESGRCAKPLISSACPAVTRLIRVRFPQLIDHVLPLLAPVELAARMAAHAAMEKTGLPREKIGTVFISPCPAKVTAAKMPLGSQKSELDAVVAMKEVYPILLSKLGKGGPETPRQSGRIGMGWAESGGEAAGLVTTDHYLAADGIENVIRVLEDLEDEKFLGLDFVELNACSGGCVGGVLTVENPYIAKTKIKQLRRYAPVSQNHLPQKIPAEMKWDTDLEYAPVMELGDTREESFERAAHMEKILADLPGLDCGSCGAPTCKCLAEDIVRGVARKNDCVVMMRQKWDRWLHR